jgi:hypothetical protein
VSPDPSRCRRSRSAARPALVLALGAAACSGTLDAGADEPKGKLPVDNRNPVVLCDDGPSDNWQGEYAMLLASAGDLRLTGIVITSTRFWPSLDDNMSGWTSMVTAARQAGLKNIPDPLRSDGAPLVAPRDGIIDSTSPNGSDGARFIVAESKRVALPFRPLVVVTGGGLTEVADAYLLDHTLADRVVVVSWLGALTADGTDMGVPNGDLDPWADIIVAQRMRYIQVSAVYDQSTDVPSSILAQLPTNTFTSWIRAKQPKVWSTLVAADQVGVLTIALPSFVATAVRVVERGAVANTLPTLANDASGPNWLVTQVTNALGPARLWQMLLDPATFNPN